MTSFFKIKIFIGLILKVLFFKIFTNLYCFTICLSKSISRRFIVEAQTTYNSNDNGPVSKCGGCNKLGEAPGVTMHRRLPPTSLVDQKEKQKEYNYRRLYEHFKR